MKIDISGGYNIYKKTVSGEKTAKSGTAGDAKKSSAANSASNDVVEISRGNTAIADKSLIALKSRLQSDINLSASSDRIEQLRAAVKNGTYHVPTEALVDSILGD